MTAFLGGARRRRAYPAAQTTTTGGGGGGGGGSPLVEPDADGALVYLKGQDGYGPTPTITIADSSGNGYNSTSGVGVKRIYPHPIKDKSLCKLDTSPTFPNTGVVLPSEYSIEIFTSFFGAVDQNVYYGEVGKDFAGIRVNNAQLQVFTNTWTVVPYYQANLSHFSLIHVKRLDSGPNSIVMAYVDGVEVYQSAPFARLAAGTTGRVVFSGTNMYWSHLRFWTTPRTDAQIAEAATHFHPQWT